jgi:sec-independent protein translocase protein TatA
VRESFVMGTFSMWHWLIVLAVILIIFGAGKLPNVMGDLAKGIKNFKAGIKDEENKPVALTKDDAKAETVDIKPETKPVS